MYKTTLLLFLGIVCPCLLFGQGETSNWYFGKGAGIRFNNDGSVTALTNGKISTTEGCATISDAFGNLLFYTDGITVYDRNHAIMENGTGLYGDPSSTQSALIVPKPEDPNIFYIFTVDTSVNDNDPNFGLNYSVVDLSLNGGNGAITQKNTRLLQACSEKITAVIKDCFEKSIWVITLATANGSPGNFNTYHAFEVNTSGVTTSSVKSTFAGLDIQDARGYLKLSLDGTKIASANSNSGLFIYDFDADTGRLSNQKNINIAAPNKNPYGIEFSPNNRFLYVHTSNDNFGNEGRHSSSLIQYDISASNISSSEVLIENRSIYRGALQLGDNGKIYRTIAYDYNTGSQYLGVINKPDEKGLACNYEHNAVFLGGKIVMQGLPPFIQSFFNKTDLIKNVDGTTSSSLELCEGDGFVLEAEDFPGATYAWEKDGTPITNPGKNIFQVNAASVADSGRYHLEITLADPSECPIIGESLIAVYPVPKSGTLSLVQCDVDNDPTDGFAAFNLEQIDDSPVNAYTFYESIPDRDNDVPIPNPVGYVNTQPFTQTLFFKVSNNVCENSGEINLQVAPSPISLSPIGPFYTCDENPEDAVLEGTFDLEQIRQDSYPNFEVSFYKSLDDVILEQNPLSGNYTTVSSTIYMRIENSNQCQSVEELELIIHPTPSFEFLDNYLVCTDGAPLDLTAPSGYDTYRWIKLEGGSELEISSNQQVSLSAAGDYRLEIGTSYTNNGQTTICSSSKDFKVGPSNRAVIQDVVIKDISKNNTVEINVSGDGMYEYSLDGNAYQESNFFENVSPGFYTVYIRDRNGCGISEKSISVIGYPKFFTPNGDGVNDFWQVVGLNQNFQPNSMITIYDRYGSFIGQLRPTDKGWDGTFNSRQLPASDYWFRVYLEDGREFKGHFALKR